MTAPELSIIIPVWNGADEIGACLAALERQTLARDRFEVIVVDNGSTDATGHVVARHPWITLLHEPLPGSYRARNLALAAARGEMVAFTDADCTPHDDWAERALAAARQHPDDVVAGHVALVGQQPLESVLCADYEQLFAFNQEHNARWGHCVTANWTSARATLVDMGGFDATLKSGGDFALSGRLTRVGRRIVFDRTVAVNHPIRGRAAQLFAKRRRTVGGQRTLTTGRLADLRLVEALTRNLVRQQRQVLASSLPFARKAKLSGLVGGLYVAALVEQVRLIAGGEPRRS